MKRGIDNEVPSTYSTTLLHPRFQKTRTNQSNYKFYIINN